MDEPRNEPPPKRMPRVRKIPRSPAQIEASRKNGAKSVGALSPETKRICSMNACKDGL